MDSEGVYRTSGSSSQITEMKQGFEKNLDYDISDPDVDIKTITSVLKQYLRHLPTPLITYPVYDLLLDAGKIPGTNDRINVMRSAIADLPPRHRDCLEFLIFHLARVIEHKDKNLMTTMNCAVVFAPTVMRPESLAREMSDTKQKTAAVQFLIENCYAIFLGENGTV